MATRWKDRAHRHIEFFNVETEQFTSVTSLLNPAEIGVGVSQQDASQLPVLIGAGLGHTGRGGRARHCDCSAYVGAEVGELKVGGGGTRQMLGPRLKHAGGPDLLPHEPLGHSSTIVTKLRRRER
jgi:hypothetical protein